jgi:hypothetical protein
MIENKEAGKLIEAIKKTFGQNIAIATGVVSTVDAEKSVCDIELDSEGADLLEVRLRAVIDDADAGMIAIPKLGSEVVIGKINTSQWVVLVTSELEEVRLKIGNITCVINESGIVLNGGDLDGMVKINDLVNRLNTIENKVNSIISHYNTHNHNHPQGPTTGLLSPFTGGTLTLTQKNDLENPLIKQ